MEIKQVSQLKIKQEYSNLVPPLTVEEFTKLKISIQKYGQWHKIIVNSDGYILDGHHRYRACKELGIEPKTEVLIFESESHEKLYVIDNVSERRHLNTFQKVELELKKKPLLEDIAKQNMLSGLTLTIGIAASLLNCKFIGIEVVPEEFETAKSRIATTLEEDHLE